MTSSHILTGDSLDVLKTLDDNSIDSVITDPPYGYSFMGKDWDKAVPSVDIWRECLRVLKPGAFCMVMSAPRSDVQNAMISRLMEAGFRLDFTPIYWTYASGFPKAGNIGKLVDKRNGRHQPTDDFKQYLKAARLKSGLMVKQVDEALGFTNSGVFSQHYTGNNLQTEYPTVEKYAVLKTLLSLDGRYDEIIEREEAEREVIKENRRTVEWKNNSYNVGINGEDNRDITAPATDAARALDGSYAGFQPKPAVEVIIVAMKPLSEKTYVDQAMKNGHGVTWLDDCRVPTDPSVDDKRLGGNGSWKTDKAAANVYGEYAGNDIPSNSQGRFPANLLVSDDIINGGIDYSRFFDVDKWAQTLPFLIAPKASKGEKNRGLDRFEERQAAGLPMRSAGGERGGTGGDGTSTDRLTMMKNHHPTVKPLKLMSYLITLTSRPGDVVLDPFVGSGTTAIAAEQLGRVGIGIEREPEYAEIASARLSHVKIEHLPQLPKEEPVPTDETLETLTVEQTRLL